MATRYTFAVECWDPSGNTITETIAESAHLTVAIAAYEATLAVRPKDWVMLRNGARVVQSRPGPGTLLIECPDCKHEGALDRRKLPDGPIEQMKFKCRICGCRDVKPKK